MQPADRYSSLPACRRLFLGMVSTFLLICLAAESSAAQTSFYDSRNYKAARSPASFALGDFNGDGILDLAAANQGNNNVSILLGNGDGTFGNPTNFAVGTSPLSIVAADVNGDGKLDLAVSNSGSSSISILLGNGDGTFSAGTPIALGGSPSGITTADLNADGEMDLAVNIGSSSGGSIFLGNGDGTFTAAGSFLLDDGRTGDIDTAIRRAWGRVHHCHT
jgi:hypothetical protein